MEIGGRTPAVLLRAPFDGRHYVALAAMARRYPRFPEVLRRYVSGLGAYPYPLRVRTEAGEVEIPLDSHDDLLTVNEIFCRGDYPADGSMRTIVDVGANVGISALWFLTRCETARVFLYEPVPRNLDCLRQSIAVFASRWELQEIAVGTESGTVDFGWEKTGRYGGVDLDLPHRLRVPCRDLNEVLAEVFEQVDVVDVLKLDVEGLERPLIRHLAGEHRARIRAIYADCDGAGLDLPGFRLEQYGAVARFYNERH